MATFDSIIADLLVVIENQNSRTEPYLRTSLAQALREVQANRTLFMEATTTFDTVADQAEYDTADVGFPADLLLVDALWFTEQPSGTLTGPVPIREIRNSAFYPDTTGRPTAWAFHHGKLILWPTPNTAEELTLEYLKDATRDSTSGNEITSASTTATSEWFERGAHVLKNWVLWDYYSTIAMNTERAAMANQRFHDGLDKFRDEVAMKSTLHAVPDWTFGD